MILRFRASDRSRKKVKFCGIFRDKIAKKISQFCGNFMGIFGGNLARKQLVKKWRIFWLFLGQNSLKIDRFCTDQTSVFNVFLTEVIICSFNKNTLQKWTNGIAFNIMASAPVAETSFKIAVQTRIW